jgi:post-segregation antitoxin (ccd killing protein)
VPKVSVYLPHELYEAARARALPISQLTQQAIRAAIEEAPNAAWLAHARSRPRRCDAEIDTTALLDATRDEFGA